MENLEKGSDKVKKICEALRKETLEPAKQLAKEIVENAQMQAKEIIQEGQKEAQRILLEAERKKEKLMQSLDSSLKLSIRQAIELLKEKIEKHLFLGTLKEKLQSEMSKKDRIAEIISVVIEAIQKEGIDTDLSVYIGKNILAKDINTQLSSEIVERLKEKSVVIGDFFGGAKIELVNEKITLDISDEAIINLIAQYIRQDFRHLFFET